MEKTAIIIIDGDFTRESLQGAPNVLAAINVAAGVRLIGAPFLSQGELDQFAGGNGNHGSIILSKLRAAAPDAQFVLVRAAAGDKRIMRTRWHDGEIAHPGWVDAYLEAVEICKSRGLKTVANISFGGFTHAMDGTGWEAFQLAKVTGPGKPGHIVVAAAGSGDGSAEHASWTMHRSGVTVVEAFQPDDTEYNLWVAGGNDWALEVFVDGTQVQHHQGSQVPPNLWNHRQQCTFTVYGGGLVELRLRTGDTTGDTASRFDCWVRSGKARFHNYVDTNCVIEPAVFPQVIACGIVDGKYAPDQNEINAKPDLLLSGAGLISFRVPHVVLAAAELLESAPDSDVVAVRNALHQRFNGKVW